MSRGRPTLSLEWSEEALAQLTEMVAWMPSACWDAFMGMERMARSGFNYGRELRSRPGVWYFPIDNIGVYYQATPTALRVIAFVDARRLADGP